MYSDLFYVPVNESDLSYEPDSDFYGSSTYEESYSDSYTDTFDVGNYARSLDYSWR